MWSTAVFFKHFEWKKKSLSTEAHIAHGYFMILSQLKYLLYKPNTYLYAETEQTKYTDKSCLLNVFYLFPQPFLLVWSEKICTILISFLHKTHPFMHCIKSYRLKPSFFLLPLFISSLTHSQCCSTQFSSYHPSNASTCSPSAFLTRGRPGTQRRWSTSSLP